MFMERYEAGKIAKGTAVERAWDHFVAKSADSLLDKSPDLAERVLRAMVESILYINNPANKASVMRTLAKELRLAKVEDAESGYEQMKSLYDRKIYPNIDGLKNVVRLLAGSSEQLRKLKVESIVDDRIVRKLEKEGLF